ncbi:Hypothetical_protein [Hexamita inflata]|uniref:Hypothetical_protein n=1 Tax=Hexamita inflata TaxID=28002 RepID=A0AA86UDL0_9EUKA|nr:Hypothetical protein HINF_LOCUS34592 [Hexamita inflata]
MPYVIVDNEDENLELQWKDDETAIKYNTNDLKAVYQCINVNGSNHSEFNEYQLLTRSSKIGIIDCDVDLSQINTDILYLCLNNCICHNYFNSDIQIDELILVNSQLKVKQLSQLTLKQLSVEQKQRRTFDYWNCGQLCCQLNYLYLSEIKINVSDLSGYWNSAIFDLCEINDKKINQQFHVKLLDYNIVSYEQMHVLKYLICDEICVYAKAEDSSVNWKFQEDSSIKITYIILENFICDITDIPTNYQNFDFINCNFIGTPLNTLDNVQQVKIFISEPSALVNLHKLSIIKPIKFRVQLQDIKIQTLNFHKCSPTLLQLSDCSIDIAQLHGQWKQLIFENVMFTRTKADCKIIATDIRINELRINEDSCLHLNNFEAELVVLRQIEVESLPCAKKLLIINTKLNILHQNNTVEKLFVKNCTFKQFSLKIMKNVLSVQFPQSKLQFLFNKFIQQKNKFIKMNRKNVHRIQNETWKLNHKSTIVNELKAYMKLTIEKIQFARSME